MLSPQAYHDAIHTAILRLIRLEELATRLRRVLEKIGMILARGHLDERNDANAIGLGLLRNELIMVHSELEQAMVNALPYFYRSYPPIYQAMHDLMINDTPGFLRYRDADDMREQMTILLNGARIMSQQIESRLWPMQIVNDPVSLFQIWIILHLAFGLLLIGICTYRHFASRGWGNWPSLLITNASARRRPSPLCGTTRSRSRFQIRGLSHLLTAEQSDWHQGLIIHLIDVMSEIQSVWSRALRIRDRYSQPPFYDDVLSMAEVRKRRDVARLLLSPLENVYDLYRYLLRIYGQSMFVRTVMRLLYNAHPYYENDGGCALGLLRRANHIVVTMGGQIRSDDERNGWITFWNQMNAAGTEMLRSQEFLVRLRLSPVGHLFDAWFEQHMTAHPNVFQRRMTFDEFLEMVDDVMERLFGAIQYIKNEIAKYDGDGGPGGPGGGGAGGPGGGGAGGAVGTGLGGPGGSGLLGSA